MSIKRIIFKFLGKENFEIDEKVSSYYIFRLCIKYGLMLIRGRIISFGYKNISSNIFIGKKVKLYEKKKIRIGNKTKIHDNSKIDALSLDGVKLGENVTLGKNTIIECTGSIESIGKGIIIGNRTSFADNCFFGAAGGITIGDDVICGQFIRFHSENHNYSDKNKLIKEQGTTHKGIKIGNNCWIGAGVVFLDGAELGNGCVVGANAVVTKRFPDNSIIAGVPAKLIKQR